MQGRTKILVVSSLMVITLLSFQSFAQTIPAKALVLSLGAQVGLPTGQAVGGTSFILGGDLKLHYGLSDKLSLTFTTGGYHFFPIQNIPGATRESFGVGPLKVGAKYFVGPNVYVAGEVGAGVEVTESGFEGGHTKTLLSPGIGYANARWDFGIRYEDYSGNNFHYGQFAARVGYGLRLNK
jgi:hypothetical protein